MILTTNEKLRKSYTDLTPFRRRLGKYYKLSIYSLIVPKVFLFSKQFVYETDHESTIKNRMQEELQAWS
jgi:hypothetical protein